ncbi:unnamed protein product [Adineta steineri]|uniref:F-box domain-containing protein n=1 Tax=Adineta steineri TaxID=433720 RepID=A0A819CXQ4_9BILA|nr:unnamed protein product [Adineta steineri]CAF3823686.1 unnamed protein product [Adineta steineri]
MTLELLPNEILLECFQYLNTLDIFHSFDGLNNRFYKLIRNISLQLDLQYISNTKFAHFCTKTLSDPKVKQQIYSLKLSNKIIHNQVHFFFSLHSFNEFSQLRSLTLIKMKQNDEAKLITMLPFICQLHCFQVIDSNIETKQLLTVLPISKLKRLAASSLPFDLIPIYGSIIDLRLSHTSWNEVYQIFKYLRLLKYLHIEDFTDSQSFSLNSPIEMYPAIHLKKLVITKFDYSFNKFQTFVKSTPKIKTLDLNTYDRNDFFDADRWVQLITASLPDLIMFKFKFFNSYRIGEYNILDRLKQFRTDFWYKQHHWHTEYVAYMSSILIYTIPYTSDTYIAKPNIERYYNHLRTNSNVFDNVINLTLHQNKINDRNLNYFSNVVSLKLEYFFLQLNNIEQLKMVVNLSNVQHLTISDTCQIQDTYSFLRILQEMPQLSSLAIQINYILTFFNDDTLCNYLNNKIKKLDINGYPYYTLKDSTELIRFGELFSNVEQITCYYEQLTHISCIINYLSKLSCIKVIIPIHFSLTFVSALLKGETDNMKIAVHIEHDNTFNTLIYLNR